jgi:hypothetical protein
MTHPDATAKHVYWTILCKTPGCNTPHYLRYVGIHDGRPIYALPPSIPASFLFQCAACGKTHEYTRDNVKAASHTEPPPPDWSDRL